MKFGAAIDALLGNDDSEGDGIRLIGQSAFWAFGMRGGLIIEGQEGQEAEQRLRYRLGDLRFEQMIAHFNREMERALLTGPGEDEKAALRQEGDGGGRRAPVRSTRGSGPKVSADRRILLDQNPESRRGRLRDLLSAREVLIELNEMIARELIVRDMTKAEFTELLGGGEDEDYSKARDFTDGMPSTIVSRSR